MRLQITKQLIAGDFLLDSCQVSFREEGFDGKNHKRFHLTYYVKDKRNAIQPYFIEKKEVNIYDDEDNIIGAEEKEVKTFLPKFIDLKKSNEEIREMLASYETTDLLYRFVLLYFDFVKTELQKITGDGTVEILMGIGGRPNDR